MSPDLTRAERQVLFAISRELVYRTDKGAVVRQVPGGVGNLRCDRAARALVARGLAVPPPEYGGSFYTLTDEALPYLRQPEPTYLGGSL